MSTWVHVTCIVTTPVEIDMEAVFGKELPLNDDWPSYNLYKQDEEKWRQDADRIIENNKRVWDEYEKNPDRYLPVGSEGSLKHKGHVARPDGLHEYHIDGALRNRFDDYKYVKWFQEKFLNWLNDCDIEEADGVHAFVAATNGVGTLSWEYGEEQLNG